MPKHVLIVDDNDEAASLRADLIPQFSGGDFTAEALFGGQDCLNRFSKEPKIDILVLDIDMPEVSGADVIRAILKMNPIPNLKIIPLTAWGDRWLSQWHMEDIRETPLFKSMVLETYERSSGGIEPLIERLRESSHAS